MNGIKKTSFLLFCLFKKHLLISTVLSVNPVQKSYGEGLQHSVDKYHNKLQQTLDKYHINKYCN